MNRRQFLATGAVAAGSVVATSCRPTSRPTLKAATTKAPNELVFLSATQMAELVRRKKISVTELVQAHIDRINQVNPKINAVVYLDAKRALKAAREADKTIGQGHVEWDRQPFFGVPFTVKNNLDVKGIPTTAGAPSRKASVAETDAYIVKQLKSAGGIYIGSTNMPLLGLCLETENSLFGCTNNPHDLTRTAGGSSGGEAAIVAAAGSPLGIGTDFGHSVRLPGSWCGIPALRPSAKHISFLGIFPPRPENPGPLFSSIGPMARTVADLQLALPFFVPTDAGLPAVKEYHRLPLHSLNVAILAEWGHGKGNPTTETRRAVDASAAILARAKANIRDARAPFFDQTDDLVDALAIRDLASPARLRQLTDKFGAQNDPQIRQLAQWIDRRSEELPPAAVAKCISRIPAYKNKLRTFFEQHDALILPVASMPAPKHRTVFNRENSDGVGWTCIGSFSNSLASGTVPAAMTSDGLPIGVQVVAKQEAVVLRILAELENAFGGSQIPPI